MWTSYIAIFRVENTGIFFGNISAINLNQLEIKFNTEVDKTSAETVSNYSLAGVDLTANDKLELESDNKTVIVNLNTVKAQYAKEILKVKGSVIYSKDMLKTVPEYTKELTFADTSVPTVKSVKVDGNKKLTVEFSETVKVTPGFISAAGTKFKIDGQYLSNLGFSSATAVNATTTNYANKIELNFSTALTTGSHTLTTLEGTSTDLVDAAGFKAVEQTSNFTVESVTNAPIISSISAENNGTVYVTFDRSMDTNATTLTNYTVNGSTNPTVAAFKDGSDKKIVKLTFAAGIIAKGANAIEINKDVKDTYGNKMDADNNVRVSFNATEDTTKPLVTTVTPITNTKVRVKYSEDVSASYATNTSNYTVKDSSGNTVVISSISPIAGDTYELNFGSALTGSTYSLEIKNIVDLAATPNKIDTYTTSFAGKDDVAPTVSSVIQVAGSTTKVAVLFSEGMDASTITNTSNYYYKGNDGSTKALPSGTTLIAGSDNKSVEITFPSSYTVNGVAATEYSVIQLNVTNVKDAAGNLLSGIATGLQNIVSATSGTAPTYVAKSFKLTADSSKVVAEFELNQNITSLDITDFTIQGQAPDTGYMSGKKVVLEFTNAGKMSAIKAAGTTATLATVAQNSKNIYGTPIAAIVGQSVYEDAIAPELSAITVDSTDSSKIIVDFSENIDQTILGLYTDDFTVESNGSLVTISSVTTGLSNDKIVLNLASSLSTSAVVKVASTINIKDLATDGAETSNMYVPSTNDKNGTTGAIAATSVNQANVNAVAAALANTLTAGDGTTAAGTVILPTVPAGYTIAVKTTSDATKYDADGKVQADGTATVVYTVTHTASGLTADTGNVTVTVDVA